MIDRDGRRHLVVEAAAQARHLAAKHAHWAAQADDPGVTGLFRRLADDEGRLAAELQRWLEWTPGIVG
ncbi:MAG: hypothetical protein RDU89_09830 [bacterium]|nr:hypothetical protein [bacterium]